MPARLASVAPAAAINNSSKPGGVLPIAIDPDAGEVVILLADEDGNVRGVSDFGGASDLTDISREHTAVREFNEEAALAFWEDLTSAPLNRNTTSGDKLEAMALQPLTQNVIPWFYSKRNKYFTCLLPVRYQSINNLNSKIQTVRQKVKAYPFFEKHAFVWIPLGEFIGWIASGTEKPTIPNGKGRPMSWRFFGGRLNNFTDLKSSGSRAVHDSTLQYLKDIVALNS